MTDPPEEPRGEEASTADTAAANPYLAWNDALAAHFFQPDMAGRRVFLYASDDVIDQVGNDLGSTRDAFLEAVKHGPGWASKENLCQAALQTFGDWRTRDLAFPPYIGYLAAFVLAAGLEGPYEPWAYYPRLRALLDIPGEGSVPSFHRMYELWQDLEIWSVRDKKGDLGLFEVTFAGEMIHVGIPKSQALLTEPERRALPWVFAEANLDPASQPPGAQIARALRNYGEGRLTTRTLGRVKRPQDDPELHEVLLDAVSGELAAWDGTVPPEQIGGVLQVRGKVLLTLQVDRFAGMAKVGGRCRVRRPFPEIGLQLEGHSVQVTAHEEVPGWSSVLVTNGTQVDASGFDWSSGLTLKDERLNWSFRLSPSAARVFVPGTSYGLPHLVESDYLPVGREFYLAFSESSWKHLSAWIEESCEGFREIPVMSGLPAGWHLGRCESAAASAADPRFPALTLPDMLRLRLRGGVRSSPGRNEFFSFALPDIAVEGADPAPVPTCNGTPLERKEPEGLLADERIELEAESGKKVKRLALYLATDFAWRIPEPLGLVDIWGRSAASGAGVLAGVACEVQFDPAHKHRYPLLAAAGGLQSSRRVFLVGRRPGEIVKWPQEEMPESWAAVWLVPMQQAGHAIYCGGLHAESGPQGPAVGDHRRVREWKQVLWNWRKRISPPATPELLKLWKSYQQAAKRA